MSRFTISVQNNDRLFSLFLFQESNNKPKKNRNLMIWFDLPRAWMVTVSKFAELFVIVTCKRNKRPFKTLDWVNLQLPPSPGHHVRLSSPQQGIKCEYSCVGFFFSQRCLNRVGCCTATNGKDVLLDAKNVVSKGVASRTWRQHSSISTTLRRFQHLHASRLQQPIRAPDSQRHCDGSQQQTAIKKKKFKNRAKQTCKTACHPFSYFLAPWFLNEKQFVS